MGVEVEVGVVVGTSVVGAGVEVEVVGFPVDVEEVVLS